MRKFSIDAMARQQLAAARESAASRAATTVVGGHEQALRQTILALTAASDEEALPDKPGNGVPELGLRVVELLRKRKTDLTDADTDTMREVVDFVEDRTEARPAAGAADDQWRHELMCVGHDPLKAEREG